MIRKGYGDSVGNTYSAADVHIFEDVALGYYEPLDVIRPSLFYCLMQHFLS